MTMREIEILAPLLDADAPPALVTAFREGVLRSGPAGTQRYADETAFELSTLLAGWLPDEKEEDPQTLDNYLYWLCQFINIADACGDGPDAYKRLLGGQAKYGRDFDAIFGGGGHPEPKWRRRGFRRVPGGIEATVGNRARAVYYKHMPVLSALHDFLSMPRWDEVPLEKDDEPLQRDEAADTFSEMLRNPSSDAAIAGASRRIGAALYRFRYRGAGVTRHMLNQQFRAIDVFLKARGKPFDSTSVDDETILTFWREHNAVPGVNFRKFRTTLECFLLWWSVKAWGRSRRFAEDAAVAEDEPLDNDAGEGIAKVGPRPGYVPSAMQDGVDDNLRFDRVTVGEADWESPIETLDAVWVRRLFLSGVNWRRVRFPMRLGGMTRRLPMSLLRADVLHSTQDRIAQGLRDLEVVRKRLLNGGLQAAEQASVRQKRDLLKQHLGRLVRLTDLDQGAYHDLKDSLAAVSAVTEEPQRAAGYVAVLGADAIGSGDPGKDSELRGGWLALQRLRRRPAWNLTKEEVADEGSRQRFAAGALALTATRGVLDAIDKVLGRLARTRPMDARCGADLDVFRAELTKLYAPQGTE